MLLSFLSPKTNLAAYTAGLKMPNLAIDPICSETAFLGGRFVGESALLRFYVLHCVGLPLVAGFLMAIHFWRIRRDGGISGPL